MATAEDALNAAYSELERLLASGAPIESIDALALAERTGAALEAVLDLQAAMVGFAQAFTDPLPLEPADRLTFAPGSRVGKYVLEEELGRGGMGVVYRARDALLERVVAIKFAAPARCTLSQRLQDRFLREARSLARLRHPSIVAIFDRGEHEGVPYFVMDFVGGESLQALLEREGALRQSAAAALCRDLARALAFAHEHGMLHRDVKPANVMLDAEGAPVLTDFGLVRLLEQQDGALTLAGSVVGTAAYMAPEQARGASKVDARADVYALGAVLYRMLTGSAPFEGEGSSPGGILAAKQARRPTPIREVLHQVDPALAAACMRCLEPDPDARMATAAELESELDRVLASDRLSTPRASAVAPLKRRRPRSSQPGGFALLASLAAAGLLGLWAWAPSAPAPESQGDPSDGRARRPPEASKLGADVAPTDSSRSPSPTPPAPSPPALPSPPAPARAPRVTITAPGADALQRAAFVLEGHVSSPAARVVSVDGREVALDAGDDFAVAIEPRVTDGPWEVVVSVRDARGGAVSLRHRLVWDATPPELVLSGWRDDGVVRDASARVRARLMDAHPPATLTVAGVLVDVDPGGRFDAEVALDEGSNAIPIRGVDRAGNAFARDLKIARDSTPPELDVVPLPEAIWKSPRRLRVEWRVNEAGCSATATHDGEALEVVRKGDALRAKARLHPGDNQITISATDRAGNRVAVTRVVSYYARGRPPKGTWWRPTRAQLASAARRGRRVWFQNPQGRFVLVPPGSFLMGGPAGTSWKNGNVTPHTVTLTTAFYLCATEVTNEQLRALSPRHDSGSAHGLSLNDPKQPAVGVTWVEAQVFCAKLSRQDPEWSYRLPTEAEWEYACRAGSTSLYPWGEDSVKAAERCNLRDFKSEASLGWTRYAEREDDDGHRVSAPVGSRYPPNAWGIFDMPGNVGEWVQDRYAARLVEDARDPTGPEQGSRRVRRGGSWSNTVDYCRSGFRKGYEPGDTDTNRGFRLVAVRKR